MVRRIASIKPVPQGTRKYKTTIRIPGSMESAMLEHLKSIGHSLKRRSQWVEGQLDILLNSGMALDLSAEEFMERGNNVTLPLSINADLRSKINELIDNDKENRGVDFSSFCRTAISQGLIRRIGHERTRS